MAQKRTSYNPTSARRFLYHFNELLKQLKEPKPKGMFLSTEDFGGIEPSTLLNRFTDALKYLRENQLVGNPYKPEDYDFLHAVMKKSKEPGGVRLVLNGSMFVQDTLRAPTQVQDAADWKEKVQRFVEDSPAGHIEQVTGCRFTPETIAWMETLVKGIGAEYIIDGDRVTLIKNA